MNNDHTTVREPARKEPAPVPAAPALLPQTGEYSLIQLEVLAGIALKQATRSLPLSSAWAS